MLSNGRETEAEEQAEGGGGSRPLGGWTCERRQGQEKSCVRPQVQKEDTVRGQASPLFHCQWTLVGEGDPARDNHTSGS